MKAQPKLGLSWTAPQGSARYLLSPFFFQTVSESMQDDFLHYSDYCVISFLFRFFGTTLKVSARYILSPYFFFFLVVVDIEGRESSQDGVSSESFLLFDDMFKYTYTYINDEISWLTKQLQFLKTHTEH